MPTYPFKILSYDNSDTLTDFIQSVDYVGDKTLCFALELPTYDLQNSNFLLNIRFDSTFIINTNDDVYSNSNK